MRNLTKRAAGHIRSAAAHEACQLRRIGAYEAADQA